MHRYILIAAAPLALLTFAMSSTTGAQQRSGATSQDRSQVRSDSRRRQTPFRLQAKMPALHANMVGGQTGLRSKQGGPHD